MRLKLEAVEREQVVALAKDTLFDKNGKDALNWIKDFRKLKEDVIRKFEIGYVPSSIKNFDGDKHELAGRVIFPIRDNYGELVAISSRDLNLVNSKEHNRGFWHESFDKSLYLYGLNLAKEHIIKHNKAIVVEGEIDTMALWSRNINCSVGILGSAISVYQISVLARYCNEIFVVSDSDIAGQQLLDRVDKIRKERNLDLSNIKVFLVRMPTPDILGEKNISKVDPDWFLCNRKKEEFIEILSETKHNSLIGIK